MTKLYLIDGNSYVYRAFFAVKGLRDSKGRPTNAIYGFTNTLLKILRDREPDGIAVAFDLPVPTVRHEMFEDYKANRPETPDDLTAQFPAVREVIAAMNIPVFEVPGYEADDVLATIAEKARKKNIEIYIVTGDKDMLQLVDDTVKVYDPVKDRVLDRDYVLKRFSLPPERVTEYMALTGDAADNIPGIKGIGDKTAKELLGDFESLDELLEHPERIKRERIRKLVEEGADSARLSKRLAEIVRNVPLEIDIKELAVDEPDWEALGRIFADYEFTSLMKFIPRMEPPAREVRTLMTLSELKKEIKGITGAFALSAEGTEAAERGGPMEAELVGVALAADSERPLYLPLTHRYIGAPEQLGVDKALDALRPLLYDESVPKVGHDLKYTLLLLHKHGIEVRGPLYDTMLASYILNPLRAGHSLGSVAIEALHVPSTRAPESAKREDLSGVLIEEAAPLAAEKAALSLELKDVLFKKLKDAGLDRLYFELEMPLLYVLARMEALGVKIDAPRLNDISKELDRGLESLTKRIYFLAGEEFNINSPKQLGRILFDVLGLTPTKKKKTGYSTDISVLEELVKHHELPAEVLHYRTLNKLRSTYVDVLPGLVEPSTGRVHTSFNQAVTATGRLSSSAPNLQNIPIRGEWGRRVREAFVAEEGRVLISADYSQVELRVLAHLSGDEGLIAAFKEGVDIHTRTASEVFGVSEKKVTADMRRLAKSVNFGIVYGMTPFGLSDALDINTYEAGQYIERYFESHPGVRDYMDNTLEQAKKDGCVSTLYGRVRPLPELQTPRMRALGARLAFNSPIQGTAADIIKIAMLNLHRVLKDMKTEMILQVHDELLFEAPEEEAEEAMEIIVREMAGENDDPNGEFSLKRISVPLKVEIGKGKNWAEAH